MRPPTVPDTAKRPPLRSATPLITLGVTWLVRKAMMSTYESRTGKPAPVIHSREAPVLSKVLWSAALATLIAVVEIVVFEVLDRVDEDAPA